MSEEFYVYEHIRNDTNEIFYVGKGKSNRCDSTWQRNRHWKHIVAKAGGFSVNKLVENISESIAFKKEIERIAQLKSIGIKLCNMTNGGEGTSGITREFSEESKAKMKENHADVLGEDNPMWKQKHTPEALVKISGNRTYELGEKNHSYGKKASEETCAKISLNHADMSGENNPMHNKNHTTETRAKQSAAILARPKLTCPYCGKVGAHSPMKQWHFDNCKIR